MVFRCFSYGLMLSQSRSKTPGQLPALCGQPGTAAVGCGVVQWLQAAPPKGGAEEHGLVKVYMTMDESWRSPTRTTRKNHRKTMGKSCENGGLMVLMGFNGISWDLPSRVMTMTN